MDGESFFLVMPYCNTECMQVFLNQLRSTFPDDVIVLVCDGAAWHKSGTLEVPELRCTRAKPASCLRDRLQVVANGYVNRVCPGRAAPEILIRGCNRPLYQNQRT